MSVSVKTTQNNDSTYDVEITCKKCGGHITHSNEYGMFCDKECDLAASIEAKKVGDKFINDFLKLTGDPTDE